MTLEDERIISLYWERNEHAIMETVKKYGSYCGKIAKNILGNTEDAEECVSDTYMQAWNSIPPHRPKMLSAFLGRITRNLSYNKYKHSHAEKRGGGEISAVLEELSELVSGCDDVERIFEEKELISAINSFLGTLSPKKRGIFICRYWFSDGISQIAAQYGMKEGAVSMLLNRLRRKLHDYLTERGFTL